MNRIKFIISFLALSLITFVSGADTLKILRLSGSNITIGTKVLKVGDTFEDVATIKWRDASQMMTAKNTRTGAICNFSARQFATKKGAATVKDFYLRVNKASTRKAEAADYIFIPSESKSKFPDKRIALVIGNSNYTNISSLRNPMYDAQVMSNSLSNLGFDVYEAYDCDYTDMTSVLNAFASKAKEYDVALFYYSGHGLQENNHNYLIPVPAALEYRSELERCLDAYDIQERMESSGVESRIICLDACRDVKTSWTRSAGVGLTTMEGNPGTVFVCSTRSGQVALDGETDNSPFASAFISALGEKGQNFSEMMSTVVKKTYASTEHKQCPVVNGTLLTDFIFNPTGVKISEVPSKPAPSAPTVSAPRHTTVSERREPKEQETPRSTTPTPSLEFTSPDVSVKVTSITKSGSNVFIDVVFTNNGSSAVKPLPIGVEPCSGYEAYVTSAWDSNGNEYSMESNRMAAYKGNEKAYDFTLPPGVPVKIRYQISGVGADVTFFPLITMAYRNMDPYGSYGQALLKLRNISLTRNGGETSAGGGISIPTNIPNFKAEMSRARRAGTNVMIDFTFTNLSQAAVDARVMASEPCSGYDGYVTSAWDTEGNEYPMGRGRIRLYKGEKRVDNILLPSGVPVKVRMIINEVPTTVKNFSLVTLCFRNLMPGKSYGQALIRIPNVSIP